MCSPRQGVPLIEKGTLWFDSVSPCFTKLFDWQQLDVSVFGAVWLFKFVLIQLVVFIHENQCWVTKHGPCITGVSILIFITPLYNIFQTMIIKKVIVKYSLLWFAYYRHREVEKLKRTDDVMPFLPLYLSQPNSWHCQVLNCINGVSCETTVTLWIGHVSPLPFDYTLERNKL